MPFIDLDALTPKEPGPPEVETVVPWELGGLVGFLVASGGAIRVELASTTGERSTLSQAESKRFALAILSQQGISIP